MSKKPWDGIRGNRCAVEGAAQLPASRASPWRTVSVDSQR